MRSIRDRGVNTEQRLPQAPAERGFPLLEPDAAQSYDSRSITKWADLLARQARVA
jgi:hypothetical protein